MMGCIQSYPEMNKKVRKNSSYVDSFQNIKRSPESNKNIKNHTETKK
jgi:hypothetical protein